MRDERLPEDRDHLAKLYELSQDILCVVGTDGYLREANPAFERVLGFDADEVESTLLLELVHPDDLERTRMQIDRVRTGLALVKFQVRMVGADGELHWIEWSASPVPENDLVYAVGRDVTAEKGIEEELRRSEELHRLTLENVSDAVFVTDDAGEFTYVCPNVDVIFGYDDDEAEELGNIAALLGDDFVEEEMADGWGERTNIEREISDKSGRSHTVLVNLKRVAIRDGTILTVCRDITERKEVEERLRRTASRLGAIVEASPLPIVLYDFDENVKVWNRAAEEVFGWSREEIEGSLAAAIPDELREESESLRRRIRSGETISGHVTRRLRKDGEELVVSLSAAPIEDPDGNITDIVVLTEDITERVELERRLQQAHRLEAIGRLAGGVAHDFNNLLTTIQGFASLLHEDDELDPSHRSDVEEIRRAAERASSLTEKLLAFGRRQMIELETVDPAELFRELEPMFRSLVPESVDLELDVASDLPQARVDPGQVERIFLNLVLNAVDAMPEGGGLRIGCGERVLRESRTIDDVTVAPGRYLMLTVSDTGVGMDEETRGRIFEPFFTTKESGRGTGLGLASVYGTVKQHGGVIDVESRIGEGSTFEILLPAVDEGEAAAEEIPQEAPSAELSGDETVLLIEDSRDVRELAARALRRRGYRVLEASRPSEALGIAGRRGDEIDLVVTDVILPEMGGLELVEQLTASDVDVPVLYMSGYTDAGVPGHGERLAGEELLRKPFRPDELARRVRELLDR